MFAVLAVIIKRANAGRGQKLLKRGMKGRLKMKNLKPCPFCGAKEEVRVVSMGTKHILYWVCCYSCNSFSGAAECEEKAIKAWNTRAYENENVR